jgi:uncharacterized protein
MVKALYPPSPPVLKRRMLAQQAFEKKKATLLRRPSKSIPELALRIGTITLGVNDVARSSEFYRCLGMHPFALKEDGDLLLLRCGELVLALYTLPKLRKWMGLSYKGRAATPCVCLSMNVNSARDLKRFTDRARRAGATNVATSLMPWGEKLVFHDPDGHVWEVAYNKAGKWPGE